MRGLSLIFVASASALLVHACTNDFDQFNFRDPEGGSDGSASSVGGMVVASSSSIGGAAMSSSSTGAGECMTPADCPGIDSQCNQKNCVNGACVPIIPQIGTPCNDNGGQVCDGQGNCVECVDGSQCPSMVCQNETCVTATCNDSVLNGLETDVDCGGGMCGACANNLDCNVFTDCQSGFCDTSVGPCGGGGGAGGGPSAAGCCSPCSGDTDCTGQTWCDNQVCANKKPDGDPCGGANECVSGFCVDGVCCDSACAGDCIACNQSGSMGTCSAVPDTTICDDGLFCNGGDTCLTGACTQHAGNPCAGQDAPPSCSDSCDEAADNCMAPDALNTACDENSDTVLGACDGAGVCVGD